MSNLWRKIDQSNQQADSRRQPEKPSVDFRVSCKNQQLAADTCYQYPEIVYVSYCCVIYIIIIFNNSVAHYVNL